MSGLRCMHYIYILSKSQKDVKGQTIYREIDLEKNDDELITLTVDASGPTSSNRREMDRREKT
jgi:hypothetical protein